MDPTITHVRKILFIENEETFYSPMLRWLRKEGFEVRLAQSLEEALSAVDQEHFHLTMVDLNLVHGDPDNQDGMVFLEALEQRQLNGVMPTIVLTAFSTKQNVLEATQQRKVAAFIEKGNLPRAKFIERLNHIFNEQVQINYDLQYDANSGRLVNIIAQDVYWSESLPPPLPVLTSEVRDLFGKLFLDAARVFVTKLNPGLTGAALVKVQPTWRHGPGPALVVKISRRDKTEVEDDHYNHFVQRYLPFTSIQVKAAYTRNLGALLYTFVENESQPFEEFDDFYLREQPRTIISSLRDLFYSTCRYWYDRRNPTYQDIPQLYFEAFRLEPARLVERFQEIVPDFDPLGENITLEPGGEVLVNPLAWLNRNPSDNVLLVNLCITHGDLTGRNIMVDGKHKCWLIDFFRTYQSHILRDFVILETDIKYRLMPRQDMGEFLKIERALFEIPYPTTRLTHPEGMEPDALKAVQVITSIRAFANHISRGLSTLQQNYREYLLSLLIATLNVVRLRHIEPDRKLQAIRSAAMICAALDRMVGRRPGG